MTTQRIVTLAALFLLALTALPGQASQPFLRVEYPNGGEVLAAGSRVTVRWVSLGIDGAVAILLFREGEQYSVITARAANSGSYSWDLAPDLPAGGRYRLRICVLPELRINDFSDRDFFIKK